MSKYTLAGCLCGAIALLCSGTGSAIEYNLMADLVSASGSGDKALVEEFSVPVFGGGEALYVVLVAELNVSEECEVGVVYETDQGLRYTDQFTASAGGQYIIDLSAGVRAAADAGSENQNFSIVVFGGQKSGSVSLRPADGVLGRLRYSFVRRPGEVGLDSGGVGVTDHDADVAPSIGHVVAAPNPFNPSVEISFVAEKAGAVRIAVYDLKGRKVAQVLDEYRQPGSVVATWNGVQDAGGRAASGVYFYRVETASGVYLGKIALLK